MAKKSTSTKKTTKRKTASKKAKKQANTTLIVMLVIIFVIIGIFVIKAINKDDINIGGNTTTTESAFQQGGESSNDESDENEEPPTEASTDDLSTTQESTESESISTTKETTTEMLTLPINNEPKSNVDIILAHYTDYMSFPEDALFIKDNESKESANGYTYTLRANLPGTPNKFIGDVYVEKGTGKVTDSMGNEPWYITD